MSLLSSYTGFFEGLLTFAPLENPAWIAFIPIAILLIIILVRLNVVRVQLDAAGKKDLAKSRLLVFFTRSLIVICLCLALATPYIELEKEAQGNPQITLLVDESNSMDVLDTSFLPALEAALKERIPTTVRTIGSAEESRLGDALLESIEPGSHVLLVSDGNVHGGTSLEDVAFFTVNELQASISAVQIPTLLDDASVYISGPETVVAGTSNKYIVHISKSHSSAVLLRVTIDDVVVFDKSTSETALVFERELGIGDHKIEAVLADTDHFMNNNQFYKTVSVLEKPAVFLLSEKNSPVEQILNELYTVTKKNTLPADLSPYYAVVANDVDANRFTNFNVLQNFLLDEEGGYFGGGLVVLGGFNSFDRGGYQNAPIETLLPVTVGKGERKKGDDNIVIVLDISGGSTGVRNEQECDAAGNCRWVEVVDKLSALDIIKAQTVHLVSNEKNILATNKVAVIAFGVQGTVESGSGADYAASDTVKIIEPLDYLYNNQGRITTNVPRLNGGGPSEIGLALQSAYDILKTKNGQSNYVLLLTDGNVGPTVQKQAELAVANLQRRGVKVFTYGVGRNDKNVMGDFLTTLAQAGDGLYEGPVFTTSDVSPARISIQWGNPDQKGFGDSFSLIPFSLTHFISRELSLTATLNGYNQVAPKSSAKMLFVTDFGQPALTTANYGSGRVAALTVFTGGGLGELLNAENSVVITRTVNWAIGNPQRKQDFFVDIEDARLDTQTTAVVHSKSPLSAQDVEFIKAGDTYTAYFTPDTQGFGTFFGAAYATNYKKEYQQIGLASALNSTVDLTGGRMFAPDAVDEIVEHVTTLSKRQVVEREEFRWPFVSAALLILLFEILLRRLNQYKKR